MKNYIQPAIKVYAIKPAVLCGSKLGVSEDEANESVGAGAKGVSIDWNNDTEE